MSAKESAVDNNEEQQVSGAAQVDPIEEMLSQEDNETLNEWMDQPSDEERDVALAAAEERAEKAAEQLLRAHAEMENLRRRSERDLSNAHKYALEKVANELLPVKDSLEMAAVLNAGEKVDVNKLVEGVELTLKMLTSAMTKNGITEIDPVNEKFNPELHQAMTTQESNEVEANTVVTVFQKGYLLNGRLIRPAMVVVSKAMNGGDTENTKVDEMA
ncbi:Heat shock protein GrpE [hydrothermal vent metagenome]|uniref:Heat shock protein GrpE n=1 Tax=hydrothermal vent metagenome TaxID=652676 RepID=A0A3B1A355_9ZZZZ